LGRTLEKSEGAEPESQLEGRGQEKQGIQRNPELKELPSIEKIKKRHAMEGKLEIGGGPKKTLKEGKFSTKQEAPERE